MRWRTLVVGIALAAVAGAGWIVGRRPQSASPTATTTEASAAKSGVGCLGRIEPDGPVRVVAAANFESRPSLVAELKVQEGDWVGKGQVLAVLDSQRPLEAALRQSDARIVLAQQRLEQVRSGPKQADIDALKAERARLVAALENAEAESARYASLLPGGATSKASVEEKALAVATLRRSIEETDDKIRGLSEVRPSDVHVVEAEIAAAKEDRRHVEAEWEASIVRAPFEGRVLAIHARQGEEVGSAGLLELARTDRMYVVAEVFEADISRVRVGQRASAKSAMTQQPLHGVVERIDQQMAAATIMAADPLAFTDHRVVKVLILLDDAKAAQSLIHGKVDVSIEP